MLIIVTLQQINYCYDCALRLGFYFEALYRKLCVFLWLPLCWSLPRQLEPDRWTMALTVLLLVELGLYASCFVCGIVTAASITIVQVTLLSKKKKKTCLIHASAIAILFRVDSLFISACVSVLESFKFTKETAKTKHHFRPCRFLWHLFVLNYIYNLLLTPCA